VPTKNSTRVTPFGAAGVAVNAIVRFGVVLGTVNVTVGLPALVGGHGGSYRPPHPPLPPPPPSPPPHAAKVAAAIANQTLRKVEKLNLNRRAAVDRSHVFITVSPNSHKCIKAAIARSIELRAL
jgi:hypothetical protein